MIYQVTVAIDVTGKDVMHRTIGATAESAELAESYALDTIRKECARLYGKDFRGTITHRCIIIG